MTRDFDPRDVLGDGGSDEGSDRNRDDDDDDDGTEATFLPGENTVLGTTDERPSDANGGSPAEDPDPADDPVPADDRIAARSDADGRTAAGQAPARGPSPDRTPEDVFEHPATPSVATFTGANAVPLAAVRARDSPE